jgi:hypothetical protein
VNRLNRPLRLAILVLFVAGCLPSSAAAQDDAFKDGVKARGDRKWQEVVSSMRRAVAADDKESDRTVRAGGVFGIRASEQPYLPYYFLVKAPSEYQRKILWGEFVKKTAKILLKE